jgi:hypothetical protein
MLPRPEKRIGGQVRLIAGEHTLIQVKEARASISNIVRRWL